MATGQLVDNVCYETAAEATNAYFSSQPVANFVGTAASYQSVEFVLVGTVWNRALYTNTPTKKTLVSKTVAVPPVFPACSSPNEMFNSGLTFGAALVGTMMLAWGFVQVKKVLL